MDNTKGNEGRGAEKRGKKKKKISSKDWLHFSSKFVANALYVRKNI